MNRINNIKSRHPSSKIRTISKKCYFCGGNHKCRDCYIEKKIAPIMRKIVGEFMENYISDNFKCPRCQNKTLEVLGDHSPSLDIVCSSCKSKYEIKSKCLSSREIPIDLKLPHGNYNKYITRQREGLDFIIIIYSVDRLLKNIIIREILYIPNNDIIESNCIWIINRFKSKLSTILIKNKNHPMIHKLKIPLKRIISFKEKIDFLIKETCF
jgi:hypothetical protein